MKKVTLGLLITFVAASLVAGPKPTPTKAPARSHEVIHGTQQQGKADPPCCQVWSGRECVKWGPQSGGCANTPRYAATPTPAVEGGSKIRSSADDAPYTTVHGSKSNTSYREGDVEPTVTPGEVHSGTTVHGSKSRGSSFREGEGGKNDGEKNVTPGVDRKSVSIIFHDDNKESALTPTPAFGPVEATTVKGSKSQGSSYREGEKNDGTIKLDKPILQKIDGEVTPGADKTTTANGSKSNSFKEVAPTPDIHEPALGGPDTRKAGQTVYGTAKESKGKGKLPAYGKEVAPVTVTPTSGPVEATTVKGSRSNGSERNSGHASESKPKPTPTKVRAGLK